MVTSIGKEDYAVSVKKAIAPLFIHTMHNVSYVQIHKVDTTFLSLSE